MNVQMSSDNELGLTDGSGFDIMLNLNKWMNRHGASGGGLIIFLEIKDAMVLNKLKTMFFECAYLFRTPESGEMLVVRP